VRVDLRLAVKIVELTGAFFTSNWPFASVTAPLLSTSVHPVFVLSLKSSSTMFSMSQTWRLSKTMVAPPALPSLKASKATFAGLPKVAGRMGFAGGACLRNGRVHRGLFIKDRVVIALVENASGDDHVVAQAGQTQHQRAPHAVCQL